MSKAAFNDNRDLLAISARIFESDWPLLLELSDKIGFPPETWARFGLQRLVAAYQRDGFIIPPIMIVPEGTPAGRLQTIASRVEKEEDTFYAGDESNRKTFPKTFRYNKRDLDILDKLAGRSKIPSTTWLRVALHAVLQMYLRDGNQMILPATLYSTQHLPK